MQQIYGRHRVRGRGQIVRIHDGGDDRRIELAKVEVDGFAASSLHGTLCLRPAPPRADLLPWREFGIPPLQIGQEAFVHRSLVALRFAPSGYIEPGVAAPAVLKASIWTDAFDPLSRAIDGQANECELSFLVTSYGREVGEWAYGYYGASVEGPGRGAETLIFGHAEFTLRRLVLTVNQSAPRWRGPS